MVGERFVGAVNPLLEFRLSLLASSGYTLEPDPEGFPVDAEDDLQREEGVLKGEPQEGGVGEGNTGSREGADEFLLLALSLIHI